MSKRIASFEASYTTSVNVLTNNKELEETYRVRVGNTTAIAGIYTWDFTYIDDQYNAIVTEIGNSTITNMQIMFKYNNNDDGIKISFFKYEGQSPKLTSGETILAGISATELATADILSTNKTGLTVDLDDTDTLYYESLLNIVSRENISVGMFRHSDLATSTGSVELNGQDLVGGSSEWRSAGVAEPIDPPLLIITYDVTTEAFPRLNMKFTTSDPTTAQSTPSNSLGQYIALNDVAPSSPINESISSIQITVPINPNSALPTKVGLASVGPEIFQYSSIDTTNHQLSGVTRGIAPNAFPAGFDAFKNAENVYYLAKDSTHDLHLLFDTRPSGDLIQYRCVAIANVDSGDDFNIKEGVMGIVQNSDSKATVVIGVELPRWDSVVGVAVDGGTNETSSTLLVTTILQPDGFYDGALLKITSPTGVISYTVADSYGQNSGGTNGEFIISPAVTGLVATWDFVIMPAPSQRIPNDATAPTITSERFSGFSDNAEGILVQLTDHGTTMQENDLFYVWLKRTLTANTELTSDTGAVLIFRYRDV